MNILVCIKQVPDTGTRIQLLKDGKGIDESGIEWIINPYDEFALEEALRIKERKQNTTIQVLSLGPVRVEKALRTALAMGADKACLIETQNETSSSKNPAFVAQTLAQVIDIRTENLENNTSLEKTNWDLILTGKAGIDENHSSTGPMLAEQLDIPHVGFVTKLQEVEEKIWLCERQMEEGIKEEATLHLPALITIEKGINEPRYPSLPGIMKAKKKELKKINLSSLNTTYKQTVSFHSYQLPKESPPPQLISGSAEEQAKKLLHILKEKEKII